MKLARAVCPTCGRSLAVRPPLGGDGSCDVFPWHIPPKEKKDASYCLGSWMEVDSNDYVKGQSWN